MHVYFTLFYFIGIALQNKMWIGCLPFRKQSVHKLELARPLKTAGSRRPFRRLILQMTTNRRICCSPTTHTHTRDGNRTHSTKFGFCSVPPTSLTVRFGSGSMCQTVLVRSVWFVWLKIWVLVRFGFCSIPISSSVQCSRWLSLIWLLLHFRFVNNSRKRLLLIIKVPVGLYHKHFHS